MVHLDIFFILSFTLSIHRRFAKQLPLDNSRFILYIFFIKKKICELISEDRIISSTYSVYLAVLGTRKPSKEFDEYIENLIVCVYVNLKISKNIILNMMHKRACNLMMQLTVYKLCITTNLKPYIGINGTPLHLSQNLKYLFTVFK
jgi:hypothetical protein